MMMVMVVVVIMLGMIDSLMNLSIVSVVGILIKIINGVVNTSNVLGNCSKSSNCLTEKLRDKAQSRSMKLNVRHYVDVDMVEANDSPDSSMFLWTEDNVRHSVSSGHRVISQGFDTG